MTYVRLPQKKDSWRYENNSALKGWKPKTEGDETGFGRMIVGSLEDAEDLMENISIEDVTKNLPRAARAVEVESTAGGNKLVKKTKEHLEAEKNLQGKTGDELKMAKRELTKQRRRYRARRLMQEMQKVKNKQAGCQRNKYQDDEMRMKARKEIDEWEEGRRRQREGTAGSQDVRNQD